MVHEIPEHSLLFIERKSDSTEHAASHRDVIIQRPSKPPQFQLQSLVVMILKLARISSSTAALYALPIQHAMDIEGHF